MQSVVVDVTKFYKKLGAAGEKKWTLQKSPFKATFLPLKALGNKSVISFLKERSKMCQMET